MNSKVMLFWCVALVMVSAVARAAEPIAGIPDGEFHRLFAAIKPLLGESRWREIPWLTNVTEARRKAIAEDKPIVILTAADGSPLSRT
jgi:hypothetical protein